MNTDLNLLFGVLAVQLQFLTHEQFAEACLVWAGRGGALADLLVERGLIDTADRDAIDAALTRRLARHGGDARATLTAHADRGVRATLSAVRDPRVRSTLGDLPPAPVASPADEPTRVMRYGNHRHHADGGVGRVFLAADAMLRRDVAYKVLRPEHAAKDDVRRDFWTEAQITAQLEHPNIVPLYDGGHDPETGEPFYVMRFLGGRTLADAVEEAHAARGDGPLDGRALRRLVAAFTAVCNALAYAHSRGVVHRDMKPANVLLGEYGEVIVLDWGLALLTDRPADAQPVRVKHTLFTPPQEGAGPVQGTPPYMAPEQALGDYKKIGRPTDVYNLGATLFEILTGAPPFEGPNAIVTCTLVALGPSPKASERVPSTPKPLDAVCAKAMAREPADRYADAGEFAKAVQGWLEDEPTEGLRASVVGLAELVRQQPNEPDFAKQYARGLTNLGLVLAGAGRNLEACDVFADAAKAFEALLAKHPSRGRMMELATCVLHRGRVLLNLGRIDDARREQERAQSLLGRLYEIDPRLTVIRDALLTIAPELVKDRAAPQTPSLPGPAIDSQYGLLSTPTAVEAGSDGAPVVPGYEIIKQIGRGGAGTVYLAKQTALDRVCAVKVTTYSTVGTRFERELRAAAKLRHPNIAALYEGGQLPNGRYFAAMEYVQGRDLTQLVRYGVGPADFTLGVTIIRDIALALAYAHSLGIVHRDPKPSNILIDDSGKAKLIDFGLALMANEAAAQTHEGEVVGTPAFMAPEMARGDRSKMGPATDVFVLGASLFFVLTGQAPFEAPTAIETVQRILEGPMPRARYVDPTVPARLDAVCTRAMAREPADRYPDAESFAKDLTLWLTGRPLPSRFRSLVGQFLGLFRR